MKLGCNHPIGPLALADMIGLDVLLAVMNVFYARLQRPQVPPGAAAEGDGRGGLPRPQDRPRLLHLRTLEDERETHDAYADAIPAVEEREPGIRLLTINRPKALNALAPQVLDDIAAAVAAATPTPGARCLLVTGAGEQGVRRRRRHRGDERHVAARGRASSR